MDPLLPVAGLVTVAAITPGPNNLVVLATAARGGLRSALPVVAGVLLGSQGLLLLVWAGMGPVLDRAPAVRTVLVAAGALYLVSLGVVWIRGPSSDAKPGGKPGARPGARGMPDTTLGMAGFQFLNPKGWTLVLTVTAAMAEARAGVAGLAVLAILFLVVFGAALALWASAGAALLARLDRPATRRRFERTMGGLLIVSAALLFV